MRTIETSFDKEFYEVHGGLIGNKKIRDAVGYLVLWAEHSERYCNVSIYGDSEGNLRGIYKNKNKDITYEIFGTIDGNDFSFHS